MRRDNLADASSSFQKIFNRRHPPRDAKLLDTATFHDIDFVRGTVNYQNPWPETVAKLMEWGTNLEGSPDSFVPAALKDRMSSPGATTSNLIP